MNAPILICGATGNTGQVIAERLRRRERPFVAMVRGPERAREVEARGMQAVVGDFDDPASLARALAGVEVAYLVCTPDERLLVRELAFIEAASRAGVGHIVKCSAYLAAVDGPTQNLRAHGTIERALIDSGIDYTILRPHGFMQTFTLFACGMIEQSGVISLPAGDGPMPLVDVRDVAAAAVLALTEDGHAGATYDLTGAELLSMSDIAAILAAELGRPVAYVPGNEAELEQLMIMLNVPKVPREHTLTIFRMQREHQFNQTSPTLQRLGIQPTGYGQFVRDMVAGRTGGGNSF